MRIHYTATVWHGGFYQFFGNALKGLGHEVYFFNDAGTKSQARAQKIFSRLPKLHYAVHDAFRKAVSRHWLESVRACKPDLIILEHAPNILPEYLEQARVLHAPIFYWIDSPPAGGQAKDLLASLRFADRIFSIDRQWMTILYAPDDFTHLPLAGEPESFRPIPGAPKEYDVVFAGSFPPQSGDGYLRAKILADIPERYRVAVCGTGLEYWYKYFPNLPNRMIRSGRLGTSELNDIYSRAKIFLNIHSSWHATSVSARTYEAALAGIFQLVDYRADLGTLFPEMPFGIFRSAKEIEPLLGHWLAPAQDSERKIRAARAREIVLARHTWRHRAEAMLGYV